MAGVVPPGTSTQSEVPKPTKEERVDYMNRPCPIPYEEIHRESFSLSSVLSKIYHFHSLNNAILGLLLISIFLFFYFLLCLFRFIFASEPFLFTVYLVILGGFSLCCVFMCILISLMMT